MMQPVRQGPRPWWDTRAFVAAVVLVAMVPLLYPDVPPLVDLLGHMGRYRVQLDLGSSPWLGQYYGFEWSPIGNLGIDLLIVPLAPLVGLEAAVKLVVMAIPALTVAGFLWVAREVHGRVPPTALFALPFAYSHPFMFGFANYALSIALAFLAFGLWLRLARLDRLKLRAALFVPISIVVYFVHTFGWGVLGLLCFSAEAVRQHDEGRRWLRAGVHAALHASVMALPLVLMLGWRSDAAESVTAGWFKWDRKLQWVQAALRDRWQWFDLASVGIALLVLAEAWRRKRLTFSRNLVFTALVLFAGFLLIPYVVFSSAYADMRLIPYVFAVMLLAIRFRGEMSYRYGATLAVLGLAFFLVRIGGNTLSLKIAADDQRAKLAALDHVPMGSRVLSLVWDACGRNWQLPRNTHLGALAIVRRHGFSNDQWVTPGINLLQLRYQGGDPFPFDPSQIVRRPGCGGRIYWTIDDALRAIPPGGFDYLWMIDLPAFDPAALKGAALVWRGPGSRLYRLPAAGAEPRPATLRTAAAPAQPAPPRAQTGPEAPN